MREKEFIISTLIAKKEALKNKVVDHSISWKERIQLYSEIQFILGQIKTLQNCPLDPK